MSENQSVKGRLLMFIKFMNMGQSKFEAKCGLSNGYVNNIRRSISPEKLQQISLSFPELNAGWLMTGEGEMLKTGPTQVVNGAGAHHFTQTGDVESTPEMMNRLLDEMKAQREDYRTTIDKLLDIHQQLADTYHSLLHELTKK